MGASHAAAELCTSLRKEGWEGEITLIGDEEYLPYNRPPLSKTFLSGAKSVYELLIRREEAYLKSEVKCILDCRVDQIDRENKSISMTNASGEAQVLTYDKLVLTTGARVRKVEMPGSDLANIFYLRNIQDADEIRPHIAAGKQAVIVGGGYIGLETAAMLRSFGMQVTLLERDPRILNRVASPEVSGFFTRLHQEEGVEIVSGIELSQFEGTDKVEAVTSSDGQRFNADLVIVGVGVIPNVELAEAAGLEINNAIVVNEFAQTSDPDILAAGDCTFHFNKHYSRWLRLESVQNAVDQAKTVARTLSGNPKEYDEIPWFWSDQYDVKLQIAGLSMDYDNLVVRGDISQGRKLAVFYFKGETFLAVDAVNSPQEFMFGKRALAQGLSFDRARLADSSIAMKELL